MRLWRNGNINRGSFRPLAVRFIITDESLQIISRRLPKEVIHEVLGGGRKDVLKWIHDQPFSEYDLVYLDSILEKVKQTFLAIEYEEIIRHFTFKHNVPESIVRQYLKWKAGLYEYTTFNR